MSHLTNGCINLAQLREYHKRELVKCLANISGSKVLMWDESLMEPLDLIIDSTAIQELEVEKMMVNQSTPIKMEKNMNVVFLVRPTMTQMDTLANCIQSTDRNSSAGKRFQYHIIFVPRQTSLCLNRLKEREVYPVRIASVKDFLLDFIPFDSDLVSMEMEYAFKECVLEDDPSNLYLIARALMTIQALYGVIANISGKGELAQKVVELMIRMRREMGGADAQVTPQIDELIIIDRSIDMITPLLTQLTYEGLIDELVGISYTKIKMPAEKFASSDASAKKQEPQNLVGQMKKITLNSSENLFMELRDKNFNAVGPILTKRAKLMAAQYEERHAATSVSAMKQFVSKLPQLQADKTSLSIHTTIAEHIKAATDTDEFMSILRTQQLIYGQHADIDKMLPYIEDLIAKQEPIIKVLRLICLQCQCNGGFKQKVLDSYKRDIIQAYGYQHILTLQNLESVGLLKLQGTRNSYSVLKKNLKLTVDDVNEQVPNDISYTYSGYAPLSVRLIERQQQTGWRNINELLNLLPGATIKEAQYIPQSMLKRRGSKSSLHSTATLTEPAVKLVFFIGGITMAEVAAIRFLSSQEEGQCDYVIATTKLITGANWLQSLFEPLAVTPYNPFDN